MSQENVELVTALQPAPDADLAELFRDDDAWSALVGAVSGVFHEDVETVISVIDTEAMSHTGLDGLRAAWQYWLTPWVSYRAEVEDVLDAGEHAVVLVRDYGQREPNGPEVSFNPAAVWTVRDGKIARICFYPDRSDALKAAGLAE